MLYQKAPGKAVQIGLHCRPSSSRRQPHPMKTPTPRGDPRNPPRPRATPGRQGYCRRVTVAKAELQRKAAISDACRRAADTMKRRREERGEDYYRKPAAGDGAASD